MILMQNKLDKNQCPRCTRKFATNQRLISHLKRKIQCQYIIPEPINNDKEKSDEIVKKFQSPPLKIFSTTPSTFSAHFNQQSKGKIDDIGTVSAHLNGRKCADDSTFSAHFLACEFTKNPENLLKTPENLRKTEKWPENLRDSPENLRDSPANSRIIISPANSRITVEGNTL